jgi:hypothetical protein
VAASLNHFPDGKAQTLPAGEGYTSKATALKLFYQMGSSRCGNTASPLAHVLRLHGRSLTPWNPTCRYTLLNAYGAD